MQKRLNSELYEYGVNR